MAEFVKYLGKSKQLPLGLYENFPEFFDIKEETTKEKQWEGSAITLKPEHPPIVGEELPDWDGERARGGAARRVTEEPERLEAPFREEGESVTAFNQRQLKYYTQDLPRDEPYDFRNVAAMHRALPATRDKARMAPVPRPPGPPRP